MNKRIILLLIALLTLCFSLGALAQTDCDSYLDYGKAVAGLSAESKGSLEDALASRLLLRSKKPMSDLESFNPLSIVAGPDNHYTVQFASVDEALVCMEALKADSNVKYVQQDKLITAYAAKDKSAAAKADPYLSWGAKAMGADDLAESITASGSITVAVVDSGVANHPFINSRVKTGGVDFTDPSYTDGRHDVNGHGTHVSGTIVDLTQGLNVNILPVRVLGDDGSGSNSGVCNGILYAAESGAKVINMSLGGELFSPYDVSDAERDAINFAVNKGVTIVVAAGNSSTDTASFQPACFDQVIVVAAIDSSYKTASFSNFGDSVDVCAPGVNITSCSINGGYTDFNGTSMASPHVAAIAAMVKLQNPGFSPARVENYIKSNCIDLGAEGWDRHFGYGMPCFIRENEALESDYVYQLTEDGVRITLYDGNDANVVVPETLAGAPVISIEENTFRSNSTIESVVVPGCVREIGNFAFAGCPVLKSVELKDGVERIGDSAFSGCEVLSEVKLPDSVQNIGPSAFEACAALTALKLPSRLEAMGAFALSGSGITDITIPASLGCVPAKVFTNCAALSNVVIEEGVKRIDQLAFDGCSNLKSLALPKSLSIIDSAAFRSAGIESLDLTYVTKLGMGAFLYASNLASVEVPEGITYIEDLTFCGCPSLEKVVLPRSIENIAFDAFDESPKVSVYGYTGSIVEGFATEYKIPFVSIGYQVLLTKLTPYSEETLETEPGQIFHTGDLYGFEPEDATLPELDWTSSDESVCDFYMHPYGDDYYLAMRVVADGACTVTGTAKDGSGLSLKMTVVVGENVARTLRLDTTALTVKVGETAKLTATVFPAGSSQDVDWLSDDANVVSVDENGLITAHSAGKATVTAVSREDESISDMCVVNVVSNEPVTGEFSLRALDKSTAAIAGYSGSLKDVVVPAKLDGYQIVGIDAKAFLGTDIASVVIPEGVKSIGEKAFADCKSLKSVSLPETLTTLYRDAFKGCSKLPKVKKISIRLTKADGGFVLAPIFTPANTASAYSIALSNKKFAKVSDDGLLMPIKDGYFTATVKASGKKAVLGVMDGEPYAASKVKIDGKAKRTLKTEAVLKLTYTVQPESARVVATWSSADPEIATVDQDGLVTAVAPGKVKITLSTDLGLSDTVVITVK